MKPIHAIAIILVLAFTLILPLNGSVASAQATCMQPLTAAVTDGAWTSDCRSDNKPRHYARYYTFDVSEPTEVTITLTSSTDTYLLLINGSVTDGAVLAENDDYEYAVSNSRIVSTPQGGDYTIEATTYEAGATGSFTLTVSGLGGNVATQEPSPPTPPTAPSPTPSPTPRPSPTTPDPCIMALDGGGRVTDTWSNDCLSGNRLDDGDYYTRYYSFNVSRPTEVTISLESSVDPYLLLLDGSSTDGDVLAENDDYEGTNSRIRIGLEAGDYTIEATTYAPATTSYFILTLVGIDSDTPSPTPTPSQTPSPTPSPAPSPTTLDPCVTPLDSDGNVSGAWTSSCSSENRPRIDDSEEYYARYYTFTLERAQDVIVSLTSSAADPYLFLLNGSGRGGDVIAQNDDYEGTNSRIRATLKAGDYTIEATTFVYGSAGDFTLTFSAPDLEALTALYNSTEGANWADNTNWLTDAPLSEWHGITVDEQGSITEIFLTSNNLTGTIPPKLGNLVHLKGLYLGQNELSGAIPRELGDLPSLQRMALSNNRLSGRIPAEIGNLSNLEQLHLERNQLSGGMPVTLGRLSNLQILRLTSNRLSGEIPDGLGKLPNLRTLALGANELSGDIPAELVGLSNLTHLYLWGNDLTGNEFIPRLGELTNLQFLDIGGNRIEGSLILPRLAGLRNLSGLGMHDSELTDAELLPHMHSLQGLEFLNISGNRLSDAQTLARLANNTTLQRLAINGNQFTGRLPHAMTQLTLMRIFYFHDNAGLCAPADTEFQRWLQRINDYKGDICAGGAGTLFRATRQAPMPNSAPMYTGVGADQLELIYDSPDSISGG